MGLEEMAEGVGAGTHPEGWREIIPDCRSCDAETMSAKQIADMWDGEQTGI